MTSSHPKPQLLDSTLEQQRVRLHFSLEPLRMKSPEAKDQDGFDEVLNFNCALGTAQSIDPSIQQQTPTQIPHP